MIDLFHLMLDDYLRRNEKRTEKRRRRLISYRRLTNFMFGYLVT